jgi:hypothetical protein
MTGLSSADPSPLMPIAPVPGAQYVAGTCNIGPWEIRRRRAFAVIAFVAAALLLVALVALGTPPAARLLVLFPLWGGFFSWLQARRRFCAAYAIAGNSNFGDGHESLATVNDTAAHRADLAAAARLTRDSFLLALPVTVLLVLLPL